MLPMALGCQLSYAENSARARFMGSFQVSKALDRARKLHGYRINAYVRLGSKAPFYLPPWRTGRCQAGLDRLRSGRDLKALGNLCHPKAVKRRLVAEEHKCQTTEWFPSRPNPPILPDDARYFGWHWQRLVLPQRCTSHPWWSGLTRRRLRDRSAEEGRSAGRGRPREPAAVILHDDAGGKKASW
jgi:hypothetical protein